MRCFFTASLLVASLAGSVYGHRVAAPSAHDEGRVAPRRKSLGFGPEHPHAVFRSSPYQIQTNGFTPVDPATDPFKVARLFVEDVLVNNLSSSSTYKIRDDSYTDKNTGVTHVYVKQLVNGLEVADGDMNINIKDGMVLSYGSSVRSQAGSAETSTRLTDTFVYSSTMAPSRSISRTPPLSWRVRCATMRAQRCPRLPRHFTRAITSTRNKS